MRTLNIPAPVTGALSIALLAASLTLPAGAQNITLPRPSPHARVSQTVGLTEITIDYHRPAVNGRQIWGALVPYGAVWRAGANDNTTISFSHPVTLEGREVAPGTYGLHMIPEEGEWTLILSTNHTSWGSFFYDESEDALRATVRPRAAPFQERLEYAFTDVTDTSATAYLHWEELSVPFHIETDTTEIVLANARQELRHLPAFSWQGSYQAANYALQHDTHLDEALTWIDRSINQQANFNNLRVKARLLEQQGQEGEAQAILARAMGMATEADINNLGYAHLQRGEVEEALELFKKNVQDHPDSWNAWDSLGEGYAAAGEVSKAIENYEKALAMAPQAQHARIEGILDGLRKG